MIQKECEKWESRSMEYYNSSWSSKKSVSKLQIAHVVGTQAFCNVHLTIAQCWKQAQGRFSVCFHVRQRSYAGLLLWLL